MKRFLKRLIAPLVLCAAGFLLAYGTQFLPAEPALIREAAEAVFFLVIVPLFAFFLIWAIWAGLRDFWITRVRGEALPSAEESRIKRVLCGAPGQFRGMRGGAKFGNILLRLLSWILLFGGAFVTWRCVNADGDLFFLTIPAGIGTAAGCVVTIAGAFLRMFASPNRYDGGAAGVRALGCPKSLNIHELWRSFAATDTVLGRPYVSRVRFVPGECIVFGPGEGESGEFLYIRKNRAGDRLYLIRSGAPSLIISPKESRPARDFDTDLETLSLYLFSILEEAVVNP